MYTIRPLTDCPDARAACIKWSDSEWSAESGFSPEDWEEEFQRIEQDPVDEIFVALLDNVPVGMVWLVEHEQVDIHAHLTPWLSCLVVDRAHRDEGVAKALVAHVEAYATAGGDEIMYLLTDAPPFYMALGWDVSDTTPLGDRNVFVMEKELAGMTDEGQDTDPR